MRNFLLGLPVTLVLAYSVLSVFWMLGLIYSRFGPEPTALDMVMFWSGLVSLIMFCGAGLIAFLIMFSMMIGQTLRKFGKS